MEFLRSFLRRHLAGKPVVTSPNVGCFLRLQIHNKLIDKIWVGGLYSRLNRRKSQCQCRSDAKTLLNFRNKTIGRNLYQTLMNTGWKVARSSRLIRRNIKTSHDLRSRVTVSHPWRLRVFASKWCSRGILKVHLILSSRCDWTALLHFFFWLGFGTLTGRLLYAPTHNSRFRHLANVTL